ncbi:DEAD/DEAH box helicase [Aquimarina sp. 2-A2]|uniref:DEAD/DEAH box helicase n=1 Tax=Aquimarina sp. 2-A2 TaxID=3382644 RepID=UPI00387EF7C9
MPFKKLHSDIKEKLRTLEIVTPTSFQTQSIPVIKSGANVYCTAPEGSGKTTTLVLTTLQKLKCEAVGNAPRAIVLVENAEKASEMFEIFRKYSRHTSLRVYYADEQQHVDLLKSEIFEGVDILIATPQMLKKLLLFNGVSISQLKICSIDDAEFLVENSSYTALISITQSIKKCQFVLYSEKIDPKLKRFESSFMEFAKIVAV